MKKALVVALLLVVVVAVLPMLVGMGSGADCDMCLGAMPGAVAMCVALLTETGLVVVLLARRHTTMVPVHPLLLYAHVHYRPPRHG